jgi:hypothetical protein
MIINKRIIKTVLECDEHTASSYMAIIRTKVATWTKQVYTDGASKGKHSQALVSLTCAKAEDVLAISIAMMDKTSPRINKKAWKEIQQVCWNSINKGLI